MTENEWKRARDDGQRAMRRQAILDIARSLIAQADFSQVAMNEVARRAGLAKGTLYLYFPSKEALFLALTETTLDEWFGRVHAAIGTRCSRAELATTVASTLAQTALLPRLLAILHGVLEHNVGDAEILAFKRFLRSRVTTLGERIDSAARWPAGSGAAAVLRLHAYVIGVQHLTSPSPAVQRALANDDLELFRLDFASALADVLPMILQPLPRERKQR